MSEPVKAGHRTTEGLGSGTVIVSLLGLASQSESWERVALAAIAGAVVIGYAISRGMAKRGQA